MANNKLKDRKFFEIYAITCEITGKQYVGLTSKGAMTRWEKGHLAYALKSQGNTVLSRAIRKHGAENFTIEVLTTAKTFAKAKQLEIYFIAQLGTIAPNGLNMTLGGDGLAIVLPEVRKKIAVQAKKNWEDPEYRKRHREACTAATAKESYRENRKIVAKELWQRPDYLDAQRKAFERTAALRSESAKNMWETPGYREKQVTTPEKREKGRIAALKRWHPEKWEKLYGGH